MSERNTIVTGVVIKFHEPLKIAAADHNLGAQTKRSVRSA